MKTILEQMVENYHPKNSEEKINCIKECMQEIVLYGLSKAGFFDKAGFYGGTALRIFYGLDRFSEDLDFTLFKKDSNFKFNDYLPILLSSIESFGIKAEVEEKDKTIDSPIKSAFLKSNSIECYLKLYPDEMITAFPKNSKIKIKFEIDTLPPGGATFETKYRLLPAPYSIKICDKASLFAGKIHAILCRSWKSRVKGRDLYDYVFYLSHNSKYNLHYLEEKLRESGYLNDIKKSIDNKFVQQALLKRFNQIDFEAAKQDVFPFIKNRNELDIWSTDFFCAITTNLQSDCPSSHIN